MHPVHNFFFDFPYLIYICIDLVKLKLIQFLKREVRCKSGAIPVAVRPAGNNNKIHYQSC